MINKKNTCISLAIFAGLILYYVIVRILGFGIPCIFHTLTGFKCPGCGISGMCIGILNLRIREAFLSNPFIFVTIPYLGYVLTKYVLGFVLNKPYNEKFKLNKIDNITMYVYISALIIYGIVRNIYKF